MTAYRMPNPDAITAVTAGRKATTPEVITDVIDPSLDQVKFEGAMAQLRSEGQALTLAQQQHESAVRAVADQLGYQLPADCTDPDLIQRDISANMRRSVEACLEVGRGLAVLKTACEHGQFIARLDVLGIDTRVAQRFMASAVKFSNAATSPLLQAAASQSKLFELLVLDDEQIEELSLTGQTGELSLDDVASMSVKELRAALREERQERDAERQVSAKKSERIDALERKLVAIERQTPDEQLAQLKKEATAIASDAEAAILGGLRQALIAVNAHSEERGLHDVYLAGLVGQVQARLNALREEFNLPDVSSAADAALAADVAQWASQD